MAAAQGNSAVDPRHLRSPRFVRYFTRYTRRYVGRSFHAVRVSRDGLPELPPGRPVIVYANHPSWWDPLIVLLLTDRFFAGRSAYGPMNSETLKKYGFMRRLGVFGVRQNWLWSGAQFLKIGEDLLRDPTALLVVTAQGRLVDPRERPVLLMPGIAHLARRVPAAILLPLALEYPFWDERYPEALARFGAPVLGHDRAPARLLPLLQRHLEEAMDVLARDALSRDPSRFLPVLEGSVGVGGVYDVWRRARAGLLGQSFRPGHWDR
jgi:1-acyl-sn-glycerol-3-phosphate acyltransferase